MDDGKGRWKELIRRDTESKLLAVKDAIQTDFQVGVEDSQKQSADVLISVNERSRSLEKKFLYKIEAATSSSQANILGAEKMLKSFVESRINEKEESLRYLLREEVSSMTGKIKSLDRMVNEPSKSRICVIL